MSSKLAQGKVPRDILKKQQMELPEYTVGDVYKIGYTALKSLNKANEIIYGKKRVRRARGLE